MEQKEMVFNDKDIRIKDADVKSGILPQGTKELSRNIIIQGNSTIEGGVFGKKISIENGNVVFQSAVYADSEFHISSEIKGNVSCKKAIACADTVAAFLSSSKA